jgi:fatty acid desaturase
MHDLLVHGHDGAHGLAARRRELNAFATWAIHALVGLSGTAYRAFHMDHHRHLGTARDPEEQLLDRIVRGIPGWAYLGVPLAAHAFVNTYPFRNSRWAAARGPVIRDLVGAAALHAVAIAFVGPAAYATFLLLPIFTSLSAVVVLRSVCEHHGADPRDPWTHTRTMNAGGVLDFLWSNTSYHLEHHLHPYVSCLRLPAVRAALAGEMERRGSIVDDGQLATAWRLLHDPAHFQSREARR